MEVRLHGPMMTLYFFDFFFWCTRAHWSQARLVAVLVHLLKFQKATCKCKSDFWNRAADSSFLKVRPLYLYFSNQTTKKKENGHRGSLVPRLFVSHSCVHLLLIILASSSSSSSSSTTTTTTATRTLQEQETTARTKDTLQSLKQTLSFSLVRHKN